MLFFAFIIKISTIASYQNEKKSETTQLQHTIKEKVDHKNNFKLILKESGSCGPNVSYTLQSNELVISEYGDMKNYTSLSSGPWSRNSTKITSITINDGVTSFGDYSFSLFRSCISISIPNSVTIIGSYSF